MAMLMGPAFAGKKEKKKRIQREEKTERRREKKTAKRRATGTRGNGCVHIIPSVLLISSKDPTLRHFKHSR